MVPVVSCETIGEYWKKWRHHASQSSWCSISCRKDSGGDGVERTGGGDGDDEVKDVGEGLEEELHGTYISVKQ